VDELPVAEPLLAPPNKRSSGTDPMFANADGSYARLFTGRHAASTVSEAPNADHVGVDLISWPKRSIAQAGVLDAEALDTSVGRSRLI
jgi:hypothetical protein